LKNTIISFIYLRKNKVYKIIHILFAQKKKEEEEKKNEQLAYDT